MALKKIFRGLALFHRMYHTRWLTIFLTATLISLINTSLALAGECLTDDKELYDGVVSSYESAKKYTGDGQGGWGMYCWSGNEGLDAKLRAVLTAIMFDSRIHPAHVATALNDYQSVFGDTKGLLDDVKKNRALPVTNSSLCSANVAMQRVQWLSPYPRMRHPTISTT